MITLFISFITELVYLYQNRMLVFVNMPGDESGLFFPIFNLIFFPVLSFINYSVSKQVHRVLNVPMTNTDVPLALVIPVIMIPYPISIMLLYSFFGTFIAH